VDAFKFGGRGAVEAGRRAFGQRKGSAWVWVMGAEGARRRWACGWNVTSGGWGGGSAGSGFDVGDYC
jgi:hypothetical protein